MQSDASQPIPVNIYRSEELLMIAAMIPGLQPADITIEVLPERQLRIRSALRGRLKDWKDVLLEEWQAGGSQRDLELAAAVDGASGRATYENGILVVVLPLAANHRPGQFTPMLSSSEA